MADIQSVPPPPSGTAIPAPPSGSIVAVSSGEIPAPPSGSIVAVQPTSGAIPPPPSGIAIPAPVVSPKSSSSDSEPEYGSDAWYQQKIGAMIPDSVVPALAWLQKNINDHLDKVGAKLVAGGREAGSDVVSGATLMQYAGDYLNAAVPSPNVWGPKPPMESPENVAAQEHPIAKGIAEGVGGAVGGALDPRYLPLFAMGGAEARPILSKLLSAGFAAQLGTGAISTAKNLHDNWDKLTPEQRAEMATQGGLSAAMATAAGLHALTGGAPEVSEPVTESTPDTTKTARVGEAVPGALAHAPETQPVAKTTGLEPANSLGDTVTKFATDETGTLDIDKLHQMASDEIKNTVQPFLTEKKASLGDMFDELQRAIAPRAGAQRSTLDSVFNLAGKREQHNWTLDTALQPVRVAFDKLPEDAQVDFIDRYKAGEAQATPEMQSVDDFMRKTDADTYRNVVDTQAANLEPKAQKMWATMPEADKQAFLQKISDFKADDTLPAGPLKDLAEGLLNFKENHYRVLWKELPRPLAEDGTVDESAPGGKTVGTPGKGNRPLEGSKGFMRQSTLDSMSEGLDRGGVPTTYNPVRMFEQAQADSWRYITAQKMWMDAAAQGARVFVKRGSAPPDGFNFIDDKIGNVTFPAKSGEGSIQAGRWAMRDDYHRLLTNMLSRDLIRESAIGNGIMQVKNALTMYRLSLSPFHAFTTTVSGMASNLNRGMTGVYDAARLGDASLAGQGIKNILRTPVSPIQDYRLGSDVVKFAANKLEFLKTMRGQDFIKAYPEADRLVNDLFSGGAKLGLHEDERVSAIADLRKAVADNSILRTMWNAPLAANEKVFQPLFGYYIPRLKVATWLRDYCRCSKIMSPPNCNETLSPSKDGDDESERAATSEGD